MKDKLDDYLITMPIYDRPVRVLIREFIKDSCLSKRQTFSKKDFIAWFGERYPKLKSSGLIASLLMMTTNSPSRVHYNLRSTGEDDLFFQINASDFRLYEKDIDPAPIYKDSPKSSKPGLDEDDEDEISEVKEFAYERDLKNFLSKNPHVIEQGLRLYEDEAITGVEFPVGGRFIDILALDRQNNYVVVELKVSKGYDRVVGQLLRYMAWIERNHAEPNQKVRGFIVASSISEDLKLAASKIADVELFEYELSVAVKKVEK